MSDHIDGRLSKSHEARLNIHLEACPSCRSYLRWIQTLHEEVGRLDRPEVKLEHLRELSGHLRAQLQTLLTEPRMGQRGVQPWKNWKPDWRWGLAGSAVVAVLVLFFLLMPHSPSSNGEGILFLSQENIVRVLLADLGDDPQLRSAFSTIVLASIDNTLRELMPGHDFPLTENPLLRDDLSQEELEYLEAEIKKTNEIIGGWI
jgi:hypothetical protein